MREKMKYSTIKQFVFDFVKETNGNVDKDQLAKEVLKHFPDSAWKNTHWAWYRNQICKGKFINEFNDLIKRNLIKTGSGRGHRGPISKDDKVKKIGDQILKQTREAIRWAAGDDLTLTFKLNRWIYSRLLLDERRVKQPIKQVLWEKGNKKCEICGKAFENLKDVEIHRKDPENIYSVKNCQLICRKCHQEL